YDGERAMIDGFCSLLKEKDAELILGYNSAQFDLPYLKKRAEVNGTKLALGRDGSDFRARRRGLNEIAEVKGRLHIDLFPVVKFFGQIGAIKVTRFTLGKVYEEISGKQKASVDKREIWKRWDAGGNAVEELADYSLDDAEATREVGNRVLPMEIALAKVVKVPLFDVCGVTTGQLVEMLLMSTAHARNTMVPNRPGDMEVKRRSAVMIKGAYVKIPHPGVYENMAVLDFRGLYPSIITSHNIDPFSMNCSCCSEKEAYISPVGARFCAKKQGLIPSVLGELIRKRGALKDELKKHKPESEEYVQVFANSQALKILANSFYGYLAYARSRWYSKQCGESVTAWGRYFIQESAKKAEEQGFEVLYGDSVTSERFVTLLDENGIVRIKNVEELFEENMKYSKVVGEKEVIELNDYCALTANPLTKKPEWKKLKAVIRHKTNKRILRVNQKYGETRVTEDHSLIVEKNGKFCETKPDELYNQEMAKLHEVPKVRQIEAIDLYELLKPYSAEYVYKGRQKTAKLHLEEDKIWFGWTNRTEKITLPRAISINSKEFEALCMLLGAYIAEGSSSTKETTDSRVGASIASSDKEWLEELRKSYMLLFKGAKSKIIASTKKGRTLSYGSGEKRKTINYLDTTCKLQMMNSLAAVFFKMLGGQKSTGKKLPEFIFHAPDKCKRILLENIIRGDGSRKFSPAYSKEYCIKNFSITSKSLYLIGGLSFLLAQFKQKHSIRYRSAKKAYAICTCDSHNANITTTITPEKYTGYVYDLSVEDSHMFVDSCGQVLLHNTDSIFLLMKEKKKEDVLAFMRKINEWLPGSMELELEGFYPRGVFVSKKIETETGAKKKYALMGEDGKIKIRGFELVRRDWSTIAKDTQLSVLEAILKEGSKEKAVALVRSVVEELKGGKVPMEKLVIYTQLRKGIKKYAITSPELVAAEKAVKRGVKLERNALIGYVITRSGGKTISEKAEMVEFAKDYDADYYIDHQVLPSVLKILKELGFDEDELKTRGKQSKLGAW
ncbi:MAG: DNA polymerase domain-containing protein, partial [Candidatus Micrarchaeota archaeon]